MSSARSPLLSIDDQFYRMSKAGLFSREFRILLHINQNEGTSIQDAQYSSGLSPRGFYMKLRYLIDNDIIVSSGNGDDRRRRSLSIGEPAQPFVELVNGFEKSELVRNFVEARSPVRLLDAV